MHPILKTVTFNLLTLNRGCLKGSGNKNGCVRFAVDEDGKITFGLQGSGVPDPVGLNIWYELSRLARYVHVEATVLGKSILACKGKGHPCKYFV